MNAAHVAELAPEELAQDAGARRSAPAGSDAITRSMYSTWKIALRQRLGRPVVDLLGEAGALGLLGLDDAHLRRRPRSPGRRLGATSVASPRSRKSHVRDRVRSASSSLASADLMAAEVAGEGLDIARGAPACTASSAPASAATPRSPATRPPVRRAPRRRAADARSAVGGRRRRARRAAPASERAPRRTPRDSARARSRSVFAL